MGSAIPGRSASSRTVVCNAAPRGVGENLGNIPLGTELDTYDALPLQNYLMPGHPEHLLTTREQTGTLREPSLRAGAAFHALPPTVLAPLRLDLDKHGERVSDQNNLKYIENT